MSINKNYFGRETSNLKFLAVKCNPTNKKSGLTVFMLLPGLWSLHRQVGSHLDFSWGRTGLNDTHLL